MTDEFKPRDARPRLSSLRRLRISDLRFFNASATTWSSSRWRDGNTSVFVVVWNEREPIDYGEFGTYLPSFSCCDHGVTVPAKNTGVSGRNQVRVGVVTLVLHLTAVIPEGSSS